MLLPGLLICALAGQAMANPQNGTVASGQAVIVQTTPRRLDVIQSSDRAVINWQSFSIGAGERTHFQQPSASSVTLNRVTGVDPSSILGQLSANGQIVLVNPNGVMFGAGAKIDVAGLVATTSNIRDGDFMAGRMDFTMPGNANATVTNAGEITVAEGGLVAFVAPGVANSGVIQARLGRVVLASGHKYTVDLYGDGLVSFAVDESALTALDASGGAAVARVVNAGRISANGGRILLTASKARSVVDQAINMSGVVEARAVVQRGGEITLLGDGDGTVAMAGLLDASGRGAGQVGGTVQVLGQQVGLFDGARLDVAGDVGGGTALVGGDYKGQGAPRTATNAYMAQTARIDADAISTGNGGKAIVWADNYTRFEGAITARGGVVAGNGGFVETSGKQNLDATGTVDASAANGAAGTWLLDPRNVTITTATAGGAFDSGSPNVFTPIGDSATVAVATIQGSLNGGTSVTITTGNDGSQDGDITVNSAIAKTAGGDATLTLSAANNILLNQNISSTSNRLNIVLDADNDSSGAGVVRTTGARTLTARGGNIQVLGNGLQLNDVSGNRTVTLSTTSAGGDGAVTVEGAINRFDAGTGTRDLVITAGAGDVALQGAVGNVTAITTLTVTGNDISLANIGTGASAGVTGATSVTAATSGLDVGSIAFTGTTYNANAQTYTAPVGETLMVNAGATTSFLATNDTITFGTGTLKLADGSDLTVDKGAGTGNIAIAGGIRGTSDETVALSAGTGSITLGAVGSGDEIRSLAATSAAAGGTTLNGDVTTSDIVGNNVTITGVLTLGAATVVIDTDTAVNDGAIQVTGTITGAGRNVTLQGGTVSTAAITTTGGANQAGGAVNITGSGAVTTTGTITTTGGAASTTLAGQNAGAVNITGADLTLAAISASGSGAGATSGLGGGNGGAITLNATDGTPTITLGGNLTAAGGAGNGVGSGGAGGGLQVQDDAILSIATVTTNTAGGAGGTVGAGGSVAFSGTVNSDATARTLAIGAGSGNVAFGGAIGGVNALQGLSVTSAQQVTLPAVTTRNGGVVVTAASGATPRIVLGGNLDTTFGGTAGVVTLTGPVELAETVAITTDGSTADAAVSFVGATSTVNADAAANARGLTITAGAGDVTMGGAVGGSQAIQSFSIVSADDVTLSNALTTRDGGVSIVTQGANPTITLGSNIDTTAGVNAGAVALTGVLTTSANITIDTDHATGSDNNLTITGALNSDASANRRLLVVTSGGGSVQTGALGTTTTLGGVDISADTITTGAIATTGAAGQAGGAVSLTSAGALTTGAITASGGSNAAGGTITLSAGGTATSGILTASGGTASTALGGAVGGAISVTGADVTLTSATASGSAAGATSNLAGGNGGSIVLNATDGTPTITLGGNLTAAGGAGNGVGNGGAGGMVQVQDALVLTAASLISSASGAGGGSGAAGAGGSISLSSTADSDATARALTLTGGTGGDVTATGALGAASALASLTVTGNDIALANIGTTGTAGVTGATSVTAATAGADGGSIALTGTTYNANAQTYTAPSGETILVNGGAPTTFTTTADAVTFATGTVKLADGSDLTVNTAGGAIAAAGGIRGTSAETIALNAGAGTISVGQIGDDGEIASLSATASTTTLSGNVTTADVVGNNVTISGAVALAADVTIDTDNATNDGTIQITGATTGAARAFTLQGAAITTGAITTTGGANQDGGAVAITGNGAVNVGAVTTSGGTASTANAGRGAGAIDVTGSDITIASAVASGSAAGATSGQAGGNAGNITLNATDGTPVITLAGNLTATGGAGNGVGNGGAGGTILVQDAAILSGSPTISVAAGAGGTSGVAGAGGSLQFSGAVDSDGTARSLTLTGGAGGTINMVGALGASAGLATLTVGSGQSAQFDGSITANAVALTASAVRVGGDVTALTDDVAVTGALELANNVTLSSGLGTGDNVSISGATTGVGGARSLTLNAGLGAVTLSAVGADNSIASLSSTAATTTLGGNVTTANVAGNNVTITGAVTLTNNVTIDTDEASNDGAVTVTGAINADLNSNRRTLTVETGAAAISLAAIGTGTNAALGDVSLTGGTVSTAAITTTGGANQAGGNVTITGSGDVTTTGAIAAAGGTASTANAGRDGGIVQLTGADVSTLGISVAGSAAGATSGLAGGNAGSITLNATDGTPTITLGGNLTATGGAGNGVGNGGVGGTVQVQDAALLSAAVVANSSGGAGAATGASGSLNFASSIDSNTTAAALTLTGGAGGDVTVTGALGASNALASVTVTGNDITLANIGTAGAAGVTGATAVTAATAGADIGSIALTGTTYNANAQNYTAPTGETILINAGAATSFTTSADAVTFGTGTVKLADGSDISVSTAGGAIAAAGGIRGVSAETITLNAGASTISIGQIGDGAEIASLSATATTTTLSGNVTTADVAGNNVTITGAATLANNVTIDTDNATNDGAVQITGALNSDASANRRMLVVTSGGGSVQTGALGTTTTLGGVDISADTITTGAIATTGAAGQAGGAVSLTSAGALTTGAITASGGSNAAGGTITLSAGGTATSGILTASGGTASTALGGAVGGAISVTGADVTLTSATASGSAAGATSNLAGGNGGSIVLNATDGTPTITLGGNLTAAGGAGNGVGNGGAGGMVQVQDALVLTAASLISSASGAGGGSGAAGAGGSISLSSTADSDATARALTLTGGTGGDVTATGALGAASALASLTVTGNDIALANIGTTGTAGVTGATSVTAATAGADGGSIALTGTTYNANAQTYTAPSGETILVNGGAPTTFTTTADAVTFATGTVKLADGSDLTVNTAGGAIAAAGGIRGTSAETIALNAGTGTISVGQIGDDGEIASVALTSSAVSSAAITLSGNVTTADVAGNDVTITGNLQLTANVLIDTDNAANDGDVTVNGTIRADNIVNRRSLTIAAGDGTVTTGAIGTGTNQALGGVEIAAATIQTGAIDTEGGADQAGSAVTLTATGAVVAGGILTSGGAASAGQVGRDGGSVTITGGDVTVGAVTVSGNAAGAGSNADGGNAGSIALDATDGTPTITLGGNLTATGGAGNGVGNGGNASSVTINDPAILAGAVAINTVGGIGAASGTSGDVTFAATVNSDATARSLGIAAGAGDIVLAGVAGGSSALQLLTVSSADTIAFAAVSTTSGLSATATGAIALNGDIAATGGAISLSGPIDLAGDRSISSGAGAITLGDIRGPGFDLTVSAGPGNILFTGDVGGSGALDALTIQSAANVTLSGLMTVGNFLQQAGSGTTDFGSQGLLASGAVTVRTDTILGEINVGSFTMQASTATLTGSINGVAGTTAWQEIVVEPLAVGPYSMNGVVFVENYVTPSPETNNNALITQAGTLASVRPTENGGAGSIVSSLTHGRADSSLNGLTRGASPALNLGLLAITPAASGGGPDALPDIDYVFDYFRERQ